MNKIRRVAAVVIALAVVSLPAIDATASSNRPLTTSATVPEAGVSVFFDDSFAMTSGRTITQAKLVFTYLQKLGANAVSLDIPFYETGVTATNGQQGASSVQSGKGTPSPQVLESVIRLAEADGFTVQLRPLLSEEGDDQARGVYRGTISPKDPAEWFASYSAWLTPYLYVAQATGVSSFSIGAELSTLVVGYDTTLKAPGAVDIGVHNYLPYWAPLVQNAQSIYKGQLLYSGSHLNLASVPGVGFGFDAYTAVKISGTQPTSKTATGTVVGLFEPKIVANFRVQQTVPLSQESIEEIGIPAVDGAWNRPGFFSYPKTTAMARWVQADWTTASCDAFNALNMHAMFLWGIDLTTFTSTYNANTEKNFNSFQGTTTESAIKTCFAAIKKRG